MDANSDNDIFQHVKSIQAGFAQRSAAINAVSAAMRDLTDGEARQIAGSGPNNAIYAAMPALRIIQSKSPGEARAALSSYIDGMMHW